MTPFQKAQQLLEELETEALAAFIELPHMRYAQMGTPVIACDLATVACTTIAPDEASGPEKCNASQMATFLVVIARACAWTGNDDGTDDPAVVEEVSAVIAQDIDLLWTVANNYTAFLSKRWSVAWELTGGLAIVTMTITTGVD